MSEKKKSKEINNARIRKEFFAGFLAGLVSFGGVAFILMLIFSL